MKESNRVIKAQKTLEKMKEYLHYYMGQSAYETRQISKDINDLEELLANLSVDQKKLFARALGKVREEERKK